jgi:hypothetical protein
MSASNATKRVLGFLVLLACVGVAGVGVWYWRGGGIDDDDSSLDDDDTDAATPDGAVAHHHAKKPGHRGGGGKGKAARKTNGDPPSSPPVALGPGGPSYESAIAGNNLQLTPGSKDGPDLTDVQLSGPMRNGTFLDACGVSSSTHATVKVAIRQGHAVGVSVYLNPPNAGEAGCVDRQVRGLHWPYSAKMDSFVTTY